jgi:hypothetical protein
MKPVLGLNILLQQQQQQQQRAVSAVIKEFCL